MCVNSICRVLQRRCCDVCLRYISRKLQQLRHSPHYINPHFILKCVPVCLTLQNVQGKGICFFPVPPSQTLTPFFSPDQWGDGKSKKVMVGGGHDKWALSSESRRTQMSKPWICRRLCVDPPRAHPHTTPPRLPPYLSLFLALSLFFNALLKWDNPDYDQSALLPPPLTWPS